MKGSVTGKVVEWSKGETMDQMEDTFSAWDYTIFALLLVISTGLSLNSVIDQKRECTLGIITQKKPLEYSLAGKIGKIKILIITRWAVKSLQHCL